MDFAEARETIYQTWRTDWDGTDKYVLQNESDESLRAGTAAWLRINVLELGRRQETIGFRKWREDGSVLIQAFDLVDRGMASLDRLAIDAGRVFEGRRIGDLVFAAAVPRTQSPEEKWQPKIVEVSFYFEEPR